MVIARERFVSKSAIALALSDEFLEKASHAKFIAQLSITYPLWGQKIGSDKVKQRWFV